jgi:hypothetical protein
MRKPPIVFVIPGATRTATRACERRRERKLSRIDPRRGERDDVSHLAIADALRQRVVVQDVPRTRARLLRGRLDDVVLGPRHLAGKELLAALVVNARES